MIYKRNIYDVWTHCFFYSCSYIFDSSKSPSSSINTYTYTYMKCEINVVIFFHFMFNVYAFSIQHDSIYSSDETNQIYFIQSIANLSFQHSLFSTPNIKMTIE